MDCLFCKIVAGEVPVTKVYEDAHTLAMLDINPVNPGHVLVMPKDHYSNFSESTPEVIRDVMRTVKLLAPVICNSTGADGYNVSVNNGSAAGQVVMHLHVHIIPRFSSDHLHHWPGKPYSSDEERERMGNLIKKSLF